MCSNVRTVGSMVRSPGQSGPDVRARALASWRERAQEPHPEAIMGSAETLVRELSRSLPAKALAALAEAWALETDEAELTPFETLGLPLELAAVLREDAQSDLARQVDEFVLLTAQIRADRADDRWQGVLASEISRREDSDRQLDERSKRRLDLLAAVSHELRTPLMAMAGGAEFLTEDAATGLSDEQLAYLRMFTQGVAHVRQLLEDVLDLARLDAGAYMLAVERVDVTAAVSEAHLVIAPLLAERGQSFAIEEPSELPDVTADPLRLRQILVNLLSNASKYSPEGGHVRVKLGYDGRSRKRLRIAVTDNGHGIPEYLQTRIFERFDRGTGAGPGTGLGLPLARDLVALHGGELQVASQPGAGSSFSFVLPVAKPPGGASRARRTS